MSTLYCTGDYVYRIAVDECYGVFWWSTKQWYCSTGALLQSLVPCVLHAVHSTHSEPLFFVGGSSMQARQPLGYSCYLTVDIWRGGCSGRPGSQTGVCRQSVRQSVADELCMVSWYIQDADRPTSTCRPTMHTRTACL